MSDLLVSTRKGLFTLRRSTAGWAIDDVHFLGDPVSLVRPTADGALYAALELGHFGAKLHRRDQDGVWAEIGVPVYPTQPPDVEGEKPDVKWSLQKFWAIEQGSDGTLWAGTLPGGLFRSADEGATWSLVESLWNMPERRAWFGGGADVPGLHSIAVDPRDPRRLHVAVSCGGVWYTEDAGETWQVRAKGMFAAFMPPDQRENPLIQDPHRMVACPAAPDVLWVQHHNGVFRSTDAARTWTSVEVPPSVFGFAVGVHPEDPDTAWFVPAVKDECRVPVDAAVVVARTRDGGRSFDVLRSGLPQQHAYDLVFRHAFAVHRSGDVLAFGSSTGNLWVSEDAGDHWTQVSAHLPPIYAVCFG